jgi:tetratricopeptide (TPR) repeat protein
MLAQLHSLEGKWAEAISLYQDRITNVELRAAKGWQAWMLSDLGWCLLKSGKMQEAQSYIDAAKKAVRSDQHPDDQAATYRRLADSSVEIGQNEEVEVFRQRSDLKWREYSSLQKYQLNQAIEFAETKKSYFGLVKRNSINGLTLHENDDSDRL